MLIDFNPAVVAAQPARLMLTGPSGSGRTTTALRLAEGLAQGQPIGLVDTQRGHSARYADQFDFLMVELNDFGSRPFRAAVAQAADLRLAVLIVDTISPFWSGAGGILQEVDRLKSIGKAAWAEVRPVEQKMLDALATYDGHVIVTVNTKVEWGQVIDETGRATPTRVGTEPDFKKGAEVGFHLVGHLDGGWLTVVKSQLPGIPPGHTVQHAGEEIGAEIAQTLSQGAELPTWRTLLDQAMAEDATYQSVVKLQQEAERRGLNNAVFLLDGVGAELGTVLNKRAKKLQEARRG